jgi:ribosome-associated heat shock protein Hsp15
MGAAAILVSLWESATSGKRTVEPPPAPAALRLDRWLWCARFYRSRAQAAAAISNGRVQVGGQRAKPARPLRIGDSLTLALGGRELELLVRGLPERRGPASEARLSYEETAESIARGVRFRAAHSLAALMPRPAHRPDKKARRELLALARRLAAPDSDDPESPP